MAVFKFVVSDKDGRAYQIEKDQNDCQTIIGKKISDRFDADFLGLKGYALQITGGSDKDGFPMRRDIEGSVKKAVLLTYGVGMRNKKKGLRKRKTVRGNRITKDIVQINCKVVKQGEKSLSELLGKKGEKPEEGKPGQEEEKPKEETKTVEKAEKKEEKPEEKAAPEKPKEDKPKEKTKPEIAKKAKE
jgi:small subunit ribosomal protein S6e